MVDYSRFDNIDSDDEANPPTTLPAELQQAVEQAAPGGRVPTDMDADAASIIAKLGRCSRKAAREAQRRIPHPDDELEYPEGAPRNFALLPKALCAFESNKSAPIALLKESDATSLGNFRGEAAYRSLFEDLVADRAAWLRFFDDKLNSAESACKILNLFSTILRQRGAHEECERVLAFEDEVMPRLARAVAASNDRDLKRRYDKLRYKGLCTRITFYGEQGRYDEAAPLFRAAVAHELEHGFSPPTGHIQANHDKTQNFAPMIAIVLRMPATRRTLDALTTSQLAQCVRRPFQGAVARRYQEAERRRVALDTCAACGAAEPAIAAFKRCAGCKQVAYCGVACQKGHWKAHKPACRRSQRDK